MVQDAVIRNLLVIGEATKGLSTEIRSDHPEIAWRRMAGMRDKLVHDYMGIDLRAVWRTVEHVLPDLYNELKKIRELLD